VLYGPNIAPGEPAPERKSFADVVLVGRLRDAVARLNGHIPIEAQDEAIHKVTSRSSPSLILDNRTFHRMLVDGVEVEYTQQNGTTRGDRVRLIDFADPAQNNWVAANQITVVEGERNRRTDVLVFLNGLPVAVFELKDPASPNASIWGATCAGERIAGEDLAPDTIPPLQVLIAGLFEPQRLLAFLRYFVSSRTAPGSRRISPATTSFMLLIAPCLRQCAQPTSGLAWCGTPRARGRV
jgi:type I site-specific restriction-modification system R (restriction) subunit